MKKSGLFLFAIGFTISVSGQTITAKLDELVNAYAKQEKFNGAVLVAWKGSIVLEKGYGYRDVKNHVSHDSNSIFQIGSVTKQFTSTIILKLQEQKKLSIKDKLSKYFPGYPKGDSITIEHLLTHTSGIYSYTDDQELMSTGVTKPHSREEMLALFRDKPLHFSPGTSWEYSNSAYSLLGYIISDVTHKPYEQVIREYIFTPLQMEHSGFDFTHLSSSQKSVGYFQLTGESSTPAPIADSTISYSAGAIYSTVGDLYRWTKGLLNNKIISAASKEAAFTPVKNHYGYGLTIDSSADGKRTISHSGGIHGFSSNLLMVPSDEVCIVLLNSIMSPYLGPITNDILKILYNKPYALPGAHVEAKVDPSILPQYAGEYQLAPEFSITISVKEGVLKAQATGQEEFPLFYEKPDYFFYKVVDAQLQFMRDEKGVVNSLTLFQGGRRIPGKKIR